MNVLSKDFHLYGRGEEFCNALSEFLKKTIIQNFVDPSKIVLYHIVDKSEKAICLQNTKDLADKKYITISDIANDVVPRLMDDIFTIMIYAGHIIFVPECAKHLLLNKLNASGSVFYDKDLLADMSLQRVCEDYDVKSGYLKMTLRFEDKTILMLSAGKRTEPICIGSEPEFDSELLKIGSWDITNNKVIVNFEAKAVENYIPIIRISESDTGNGAYKRELCVREENATREIVIKVLDDETIEECISNIETLVNNISDKEVSNPFMVLKNTGNVKKIGDKRLKGLEPAFKNAMTEEEFCKKIALIPDEVGYINDVTDNYLINSLGLLWSTGVFEH